MAVPGTLAEIYDLHRQTLGRHPMRAQRGSSGNERYYACSARLQRTLPCDEPVVKAVEIETQVADYLGRLPFPEDWEAWVYEQLKPKWDMEEAQR